MVARDAHIHQRRRGNSRSLRRFFRGGQCKRARYSQATRRQAPQPCRSGLEHLQRWHPKQGLSLFYRRSQPLIYVVIFDRVDRSLVPLNGAPLWVMLAGTCVRSERQHGVAGSCRGRARQAGRRTERAASSKRIVTACAFKRPATCARQIISFVAVGRTLPARPTPAAPAWRWLAPERHSPKRR